MKRIVMLLLFILAGLLFVGAGKRWGKQSEKKIVANAYNADSVRAVWDKMPYFTLFKDNYFIGGTTLGGKPTSVNSDVKFQLSIAQRLTKSKLPFDTYLFIQYTQKAFWNVFQESLPMKDLNFNPGIGLGHLIVYRNKCIGKGYLMLEHESNGKDSTASRSWNKLTFAVAVSFHRIGKHNSRRGFRLWTANTTKTCLSITVSFRWLLITGPITGALIAA